MHRPRALPLAGQLRIRTAHGAHAARLLDERWDELAAAVPRPDPLASSAWLRAQVVHALDEPLAVVAEEDGRLVAGLLLGRRLRAAGVRGLYWLGVERQRFAQDILVAPGREDAADAVLAAALGEGSYLSLVTRADGALAGALGRVVPWAALAPAGGTWVADLRRTDFRRLRRATAAELRRASGRGVAVQTAVIEEPAAVADGLERLLALHRRRWDGEARDVARFSGAVADEAFHREALRLLLGDGAGASAPARPALVEVREDGRLVGASLLLLQPPACIAYVKATVPGAGLRSPGQLLALAVAGHALAQGAHLADLGGGRLVPGSPKARLDPAWVPHVRATVLASPALRHAARPLGLARRALDGVAR